MIKIKCYLVDLKLADLKASQTENALNEDPYNKKKYTEYKKTQKKQEEAFNKFANELSKLMKKERDNKFDLYIRLNFEKIENLINNIEE